MQMTEQDYCNPDWANYDEDGSLPSSYRDISSWIGSRSKWFCTETDMFSEKWFSDGKSYTSSAVSSWYKKYKNGCDGIKVVFTGRSANQRTGEVYVLSFNVMHSDGMGFVEFGYHQ